jgi:hypothetical protein
MSSRPGRFWFLLGLVFLLAIAVRAWQLSRPLAAFDGLVMPDDAFLYLEVAQSLAEEGKPLFQGQLTNGFQPLFTAILASAFVVLQPDTSTVAGLDAMARASQGIGVVFDLGCLALLLVLIRRRFGEGREMLLAGVAWAVHPGVLANALNGMESSLALFFLLALWLGYESWEPVRSGGAKAIGFGALTGLACLARLDLLLLGLLYAWDSFRNGRERQFEGAWWGANLLVGLGAVLAYAPWAAYSLTQTGRVFPDSGTAVRFITSSYTDHQVTLELFGFTAGGMLRQVVATAPVLTVLSILALYALRKEGRLTDLRWLRVPAFFTAAIFLAYALVFWGFFRRYAYPSILLTLGATLACAHHFLRGRPDRDWVIATTVMLAVVWLSHPFAKWLAGPPNTRIGYRNMALWARAEVPDGAVLGAPQCGALAYYADDNRVVNLDGVVSRQAFEANRDRRLDEYLREESVDYLIGRSFDIEWVRKHGPGVDRHLDFRGQIPGLEGWGWQVWKLEVEGEESPPS